MLLENFIPQLPSNLTELLIYIIAFLGVILITYAIFLEVERRQDLVFLVGSLCLLVYAIYVGNAIFMIAMFGLFIASLVEFAEIYMGIHKHNPEDLKRYKSLK